MKKILMLCFVALFVMNVQAQDDKAALAALKTELDAKKAAADAAAAEVAAVQAKIDALPGWRYGGVGILGLNFAGTNNWFANAAPNSNSMSPSIALTGFAHQIQEKYFWRNNANLNLSGLKFDNEDVENDDTDLQIVNNSFQVSSLFGYRLRPKLALSALGEYRTVVLDQDVVVNDSTTITTSFNDPGYLDIGVGLTWTPIENLVAVFHPLNYNFVFFKDKDNEFQSSLGTKFVVDYTRALPMGIAWTSNLTGFVSYGKPDNDDIKNLHNFTWTNGVSFTTWKGIGVSAQLALRSNAQEAFNLAGDKDNPLQTSWIIGLSYSL